VTEPRSPLESALDLFVYVPVGLAFTAVEEIPKLAAKGRSRVGGQISTAKVIGQFVVSQGRKELDRRIRQSGPRGEKPVGDPVGDPVGVPGRPADGEAVEPAGSPTPTEPPVPGDPASEGDLASASDLTAPVPSAAGLGIPGYDSLSASQVVQRLAGLTGEELVAVGAYETAHRARRTVMTRVNQLLSD
jgi:hypothetical protein